MKTNASIQPTGTEILTETTPICKDALTLNRNRCDGTW